MNQLSYMQPVRLASVVTRWPTVPHNLDSCVGWLPWATTWNLCRYL